MQAIPLESTGFRVTAGCPMSVRLTDDSDSSNPALACGGRNLDGFACTYHNTSSSFPTRNNKDRSNTVIDYKIIAKSTFYSSCIWLIPTTREAIVAHSSTTTRREYLAAASNAENDSSFEISSLIFDLAIHSQSDSTRRRDSIAIGIENIQGSTLRSI
jgi:hypothetical protein